MPFSSEALQNGLDARKADNAGPVRVALRHLPPGNFDAKFLAQLFTLEFRDRLTQATEALLPDASHTSVLTIEDFGTSGLLGDFQDFNADGEGQNWNAFWHREGEGVKNRGSGGGAGLGKITYITQSLASTLFGFTVRSSDDEGLLMGRSSFSRDYHYSDKHKYYRVAYWTTSDETPLPERSKEQIERFRNAFSLTRGADEPGLSVVIPFSRGFDAKEAITAVILDFYMPIASGRLEVSIDGEVVNASTIDQIADLTITDDQARAASSSFTRGYRAFAKSVLFEPATPIVLKAGWNKNRIIPADAFPENALADIRAKLESGERISLTLPLSIKTQKGLIFPTTFSVHLQIPADLQHNEEAFVRRDLLIGGELHVTAGSVVQKTRSLTWIQDKDLSEFLLAAEEPSHLKWNASLARDKADYVAPQEALRSLRQAVPRLLVIVLQGNEKKDFKALAKFFGRPVPESAVKAAIGSDKKKGTVTPPTEPPPQPIPKPFRIEVEGQHIRVISNGKHSPRPMQLPMDLSLELAYEGLDLDPFAAYDPYDFDVAESTSYPTKFTGATVLKKKDNRIDIRVDRPEFAFEIGGFDPNLRLRARLQFPSQENHEVISTEETTDG